MAKHSKCRLIKYVIKIYYDGKFIGYVKNYRRHRNDKYRFNKTKNIKTASYFTFVEQIENNLNNKRDMLYYNEKFSFKGAKVTKQEIRNSKIHLLNVIKDYKSREGIFKNK